MSCGALAQTGRRPVTVSLGAPVVTVLTDLPPTVHSLVVNTEPPTEVVWIRRPLGRQRSFPFEELEDSLDVLPSLECVVVDATSATEDSVLVYVKAILATTQGTGASEFTSPALQVRKSCLKVVNRMGWLWHRVGIRCLQTRARHRVVAGLFFLPSISV